MALGQLFSLIITSYYLNLFLFSIIVPVTITQHFITSTTTTTTSTPKTPLIEDSSEETSSTALMLPTSGSPGCVIDDRFYSDGMQVSTHYN